MRRGSLRVYLGAAPGVGKTFAMLNEGCRRHGRGTDVVVGFLETHGRRLTAEQVRDLEVTPRRRLRYRGATFEEMDVDAVLARHPEVALVDELAHTNVPGSRNAKRYQDVEELLAAGIDVISTLNIQHLESVNDVVERITGVRQRETIPDAVVRAADQVELVDMTPEALRRRMAHGNIYASEKVDAALANYFRPGNLGALRELALLWVADRVDEALHDYMVAHGIDQPWETRERVLVGLTGAAAGDTLIWRAARIAARARGELIGVHIRPQDGLSVAASGEHLAHQRRLLTEVGGEYREVVGEDIAHALLQVARAENVTQIVLGASTRSRWAELSRGSVINTVIRGSGPIDVHVISQGVAEEGASLPSRPRLAALPPRRRVAGLLLAALALPLLTAAGVSLRDALELPSMLLLYLLVTVAAAAVGGIVPGAVTALAGSLLVNWFFTQPLYRFTIAEPENAFALAVFLVVAGVVSALVDLVARRAAEAARARAEAAALARLAGTLLEADDPLARLVADLRASFRLDTAAILRRDADAAGGWRVEASAGGPVPATPGEGTDDVELTEDMRLVLVGPRTSAEDRRVLHAFADHLAVAVERRSLQALAAGAGALEEGNRLRTALLAAVSHDLRTPLASIKASATSLLQGDVHWTPEATREFLEAIVADVDRLNGLVGNLLDMSRLQTGALQVHVRPVAVDEVVAAALDGLRPGGADVEVAIPEALPLVAADQALLERVVANLVDNALAWSPPGTPVRVEAGVVPGGVDLRVVDRGGGIAREHRDRIFQPFQRLGDGPDGAGVGLGLAVARGFTEAMSGELVIEDTPGGGTTMVVSLKAAAEGGA